MVWWKIPENWWNIIKSGCYPTAASCWPTWQVWPRQTAQEALLEHIQVCLDTCHMAVAYEDPQESLKMLAENGIRVGKVQITNGWRVLLGSEKNRREQLVRELTPFSHSPYLHQVVGRRQKGVRVQYRDLNEALADLEHAS